MWCLAADTHLKRLERGVSGADFSTGRVFEGNIDIVDLWQYYYRMAIKSAELTHEWSRTLAYSKHQMKKKTGDKEKISKSVKLAEINKSQCLAIARDYHFSGVTTTQSS